MIITVFLLKLIHGGGRPAGLDSKGLYVKDPLKSILTINFKLNYIVFVISIFTIIKKKKVIES